MIKFLSSVLLVAVVVYSTEAATKNDVFNTINRVSNEVRAEENLALQTAIRETTAAATTPEERLCVVRQIGLARAELNGGLGMELVVVRREFGALTAAELEELDLDTVADQLRQRFEGAVSSVGGRIALIRQCA